MKDRQRCEHAKPKARQDKVTQEWFKLYSSAVTTGYAALTGSCPLPSLRYSDLDRLSHFLRCCKPDRLSHWSVVHDAIGAPADWLLKDAAEAFVALSQSLRANDMEQAERVLPRLRVPGVQSMLYNAVALFSKGIGELNRKITKRAKVWSGQRRKQNATATKQVVAQATKSRLTTPEYTKTNTNPRSLPGSYGWRH